jgi:hypothetical protein
MARTQAAIAYIPTVVRELGEQLRRLRDDVGMRRVVVTNLHPLGCTPHFTRALNYSGCDPLANAGAAQHNAALQSVLAALDPANRTFLLLDLNAPFAAFADEPPAWAASSRFAEPRRPCCETFLSTAGGGYCGQQDDDGRRQVRAVRRPQQTLLLGQRPPHAGRLGRGRRDFQAQDPRVRLQLIIRSIIRSSQKKKRTITLFPQKMSVSVFLGTM